MDKTKRKQSNNNIMKETSKLLHKAYLSVLMKLSPSKSYTQEEKENMIVNSLADGLFNDKFDGKRHDHESIARMCEKLKVECRERLIDHANQCNADIDSKMTEMHIALNVAYQLS